MNGDRQTREADAPSAPLELSGTRAAGPVSSAEDRAKLHRHFKLLGLWAVALAACFCLSVYGLIRFAIESQLYSYILLVPVISLYLGWLKRDQLVAAGNFQPATAWAAGLALAGAALVAGYWIALRQGWSAPAQDRLCVTILALVFCFWSGCAVLLGARRCRLLWFAIAFLIWLAPLPSLVERWSETLLQHSSAEAAYWMIALVGTPMLHTGTIFKLPDITIEVAPECSGIHSSLVLFLTALVGGQLLLRKRWTRLALAVFVIPLGILRNGFRVFTLAELCVHVNPDIINSPLHHKGGPIFFALSLIPFFLVVWLLLKLDRKPKAETPTN